MRMEKKFNPRNPAQVLQVQLIYTFQAESLILLSYNTFSLNLKILPLPVHIEDFHIALGKERVSTSSCSRTLTTKTFLVTFSRSQILDISSILYYSTVHIFQILMMAKV